MDGIDPDTLLEWLQTGVGDERDLQMMALEQLCMLLLMSDNIDRCFESCPPRTFLPALCKIFLDESATENVLEVTARAITYYLDVSNECTRRITQVDGAVKAICNRLAAAEMGNRTSKDLAEQCVKLLEHICQRETSAVYDAGGLQCMLSLVIQHGQCVHKDTMHSAMSVVTRLCSKMEPADSTMPECSASLGTLLAHDDPKVSECALRCFAALTDRFIRKGLDPVEMVRHGDLVNHLLKALVPLPSVSSTVSLSGAQQNLNTVASQASILSADSNASSSTPTQSQSQTHRSTSFTSIVISLLSNLCRGSSAVTQQLISSPLLVPALRAVLTNKDERCVMDTLRLCDLLVVLLCEGRNALPRTTACSTVVSRSENAGNAFERSHRHLIDAIRQRDTDALIDAVESGQVDANYTDDVGQTLLNWSSAFGTVDMVTYLCDKGADVNKGQRSSSLHYAACFGRPDVVKILLRNGANPDLRDEEGKTALDKARERSEEGHQQVAAILESPSTYMHSDEQAKSQQNKAEDSSKTTANESIDKALIRNLLEQVIPILCDVFQRSLGVSVRRSSVSLLRKTIEFIDANSLSSLVAYSASSASSADDQYTDPITAGPKLAESIVNVIIAVLEHEDDVEGHENVLHLMKSLFAKDVDFWLEQLVRVGVFEKVEAIAQQNTAAAVQSQQQQQVTSPPSTKEGGSKNLNEMNIEDTNTQQQHQQPSTTPKTINLINNTAVTQQQNSSREDSKSPSEPSKTVTSKADQPEPTESGDHSNSSSESPSATAPSTAPPGDSAATDGTNKTVGTSITSTDSTSQAAVMLDVPVEVDEEDVAESGGDLGSTAPPTPVASSKPSEPVSKSSDKTEVSSSQQQLRQTPTSTKSQEKAHIKEAISKGVKKIASLRATDEVSIAADDCNEIVEGKSYRWKDWRLIKSRDSLFIWCDAVAVEFSDGSNGWFRFMLDGQLSTMYSSGNPESGADSAETRGEFIDKLTKARGAVPSGTALCSILTVPNAKKTIEVGNWILASPKIGELTVTNRDGNQQRMYIMEDLPGFIFESNRHTKHCFQAESTLGLDFVTGWAARGGGRRLRFRAEAQKAKLQELAKELWDNYLKEARMRPRDALVQLQKASSSLQEFCESHKDGSMRKSKLSEKQHVENCLRCVYEAITNETVLSTFELSISGIVSSLLSLLHVIQNNNESDAAILFRKVFSDNRSLTSLVRKMVLVLETVEKFPQYLYDTPGGSSFGLQLLSRRIKLKLEQQQNNAKSSKQKHLLDRTGRTMKTEPLTTIGQLKNYILRMVAKQWYDRDRETFAFVKLINEAKRTSSKITFTYSSDFDDQGLIYWLGTNGKTVSHWTNPASVNVVYVTSSDGNRQPYGLAEDILSRDVSALNCHTSDDKNAHFTIDLGVFIHPTAYTLRHARGYGRSALRNWLFQGSRNARTWDVLMVHENDTSLNDPGSTATWPLVKHEGKGPYRYLRIAQNGRNASNQTYYLSLSGFEVYGSIVDVVIEDLKPSEEKSQSGNASKKSSKKNSLSSSTVSKEKEKDSESKSKDSFGGAATVSTTPTTTTTVTTASAHEQPTAASSFSHLAGGIANNKLISGVITADVASASSAFKTRILRYRRGSRLLVGSRGGMPGGGGASAMTTTDSSGGGGGTNTAACAIGSRVTRGPDWKWENQGSGSVGTIISPLEKGWLDVQWDDGTMNSYRFGADNKFDVHIITSDIPPPSSTSSSLQALRRVPRAIVTSRRDHHHNAAPLSAQATQQFATFTGFTPFSGRQLSTTATTTTTTTTTSASRKDEANSHARGRYASSTANPFARFYQTSNTNANFTETSSTAPSRDTKAASAGPSASSTIAQKSMSTTNLLDGSDGDKRPSVASTNQAASAESLQHPTPSLENLLARSRIYDERIAEVVADDGSATEQTPLGSSKALDTDQESSVSTNNNAAFDTSIDSFDAAFAQYAQQSINVNSSSGRVSASLEEEDVEERTEAASDTTATAQQLSTNDQQGLTSVEQSLSVSAPDLAVIRQRQQQEDTYVDVAKDQQQPTSKAIFSTDSTAPKESAAQEPSETDVLKTSTNESEHPANETEKLHVDVVCESDSAQQQQEGQDEADGGDQQHTPTIKQQSSVNEISSDNNAINEISSAVDDAIRQYLMGGDEHSESDSNAVHGDDRASGAVQSFFAITNSDGEYNDFLDAYADMLDNTGDEENPTREEATEESAKKAGDEGAEEQSITTEISSETTAITAADESATVTSNTTSAVRRNVQSIGGGIRYRLGNYAEVLRTVMQQVIDSGSSLNALELEELEDDIYDDDMTEEVNEEDCDDEYVNGLSVEALAQAAAALRRQSRSTSSAGSNNDLKVNWKQIVVGEAGRLLGERSSIRSSNSTDHSSSNGAINRNWDDEFVLKRQFDALIPAFDPRPGRTNVNQTQDVELPPPIKESDKVQSNASRANVDKPKQTSSEHVHERNIRLYIRGPNLANIENVTVELNDNNASMFYFLQQLCQHIDWGQKTERTRRVWEPTYTLIYEEAIPQQPSTIETINQSNDSNDLNNSPPIVTDTLAVLADLHKLGEKTGELEMNTEMFVSEKVTQKLMQELADPLIVSARALPLWCDHLIYEYPCLFSIETRTHYLHATAFGTSRAIVWLQTRRDQILEQSRGATSAAAVSNLAGARRDDHYPEFRVGRIKHERIKVPRNGDLLFESAKRVMEFHATRKSVLEVEYVGEEGTGLGPTLEFYALVAAEFQRKSLGMWVCDDLDEDQLKREENEIDLGEGVKPPGYYVRRSGGLFPAALPRHGDESKKAVELFKFLGIFLAKVLQDGRLVDLPLSTAFLKLLVSRPVVDKETIELEDVLTLDDFEEIYPMKGNVLKQLSAFVNRKRAIESDKRLSADVKRKRIENLTLTLNGTECRISDLSLTFSVNPPSSIFKFGEMELIDGGSNVGVTNDNVDLYLEKCLQFYLNSGIYEQINALRDGFNLVFPLRSLRMFTPEEVQTLLSGEQCPEWTRDDIMNYTEPKLGYTRESPGFLRFVDVLVGMTAAERKSFLQFTTGCSSLPPGGLANLHPRLTIVRKVDSGDGSYPSVNTCVHYLKLPDYSSVEIMRERLLTATNEKGFYLN